MNRAVGGTHPGRRPVSSRGRVGGVHHRSRSNAVVILTSADGAARLIGDPAAKDFVADAHNHCKLIAYHPDAEPLLDAAGVLAEIDDGYVALDSLSAPSTFLERCRKLRHWDRTKMPAKA